MILKICHLHIKVNEPHRDKTIEMACEPSENRRLRSAWASAQSDQSLLCILLVAKSPSYSCADSEDSDQTGRTPSVKR